jgi:hypothetical protein
MRVVRIEAVGWVELFDLSEAFGPGYAGISLSPVGLKGKIKLLLELGSAGEFLKIDQTLPRPFCELEALVKCLYSRSNGEDLQSIIPHGLRNSASD